DSLHFRPHSEPLNDDALPHEHPPRVSLAPARGPPSRRRHSHSPPLGGERAHAAVAAAHVDRIAPPVRPRTDAGSTDRSSALRRITIFDTTLRDGEQSPGIALQPDEKAAIAIQLERLGVDVIEAGFAASSPGDHAGVAAVAEAAERATVASLCRASEEDIDAAADALAGAQRSRLHVFMATSPIHMEHKLGLTPPEVVDRVRAAISYAVTRADEVEFSAEDATRSEPAFLAEVCREAIAAGATTINLPDTVGYSIPDEFARFLRNVMRLCPELRRVRLSVHCHDDLGLAVANSL